MKTFSVRMAALAGAALIAVAAPAGAQDVDATIDRAVAAWNRMTSFRATFEQTVTNPLTGSAETARGEYQQQGKKKISVRFTDPQGDRIVSDGQALWLYLPSTTPGQVIRTVPGHGATVDFTAQFLASPKTRYTIADAGAGTVDGRAARVLTLTPKTREMPFTRAKVWVDSADGLIRQFEVVDGSGIMRRVRLTSLKLNAPVDAAAFRFTPPKGVRVVSQ